MHVTLRTRVVLLSGIVLTPLACGGAARRQATPSGPPPEVVKALQAPETPDRIIYTPPASLAKPPDTTAHARKPSKASP
jgi:hypothetical protein